MYIIYGMLISSKARERVMMRAYRFYLMTIALIVLTFTMMTISVNATKDKRLQHKNEYYEQIEDEYVKVLRNTLADKGYSNAGITMTKIFYENGRREYTVKLHHKRMERLDADEQQILLAELSEINFAADECEVYLKFL